MPEVRINVDVRRCQRGFKAFEARLDSLGRGRRTAAAIRRVLDPATVRRKALGEFDVGEVDRG